MKHKIINFSMLLILIGCSAVSSVWADSEDLPVLTTRLVFDSSGRWFSGQVINLDLYAYNFDDIQRFRTDVKYDPEKLRLVYVSRGTFLVEEQDLAEWNSGVIDNQKGLVTNISGIRSQSFNGSIITLFRLNFIAIGTGSGQISLENPRIVSSSGIERTFDFAPLQYKIE